MSLLPAAVEALQEFGTPEIGAGSARPLTEGALKLVVCENRAIGAVNEGHQEHAMFIGGECV